MSLTFFVFASSRCPSELGLSSTSSLKVEEVEEGSEPEEFVKALGPQDKKAYDCMMQGACTHTRTHIHAHAHTYSYTNYKQEREREN